MTWGALANLYTLNLSQKNLIGNEGEVMGINKQLELGTSQYGHKEYYPMIIALGSSSKEFRVRDNFKDWFAYLQERIQYGDTITVYTRSRLDALVTWGKNGDVYEIDKNGAILFPLSTVKAYNKNQALILGLFASILWSLYIVYKLKRR